MKKKSRIIAAVVATVCTVAACGALTACGDKLQANGPEYNYKVIPATDNYEFTGNVTSTVVPDAEIKIDGKFDEDFYEGLKWYSGKKIVGNETGTLEMTTYFAKTGIVIAAKIKDSRRAYHSNTVATGNITCFNGYFAFGDAKQQSDGVYEVECTAGNRFKISQFTPMGIKVINTDLDKTPVSAVVREGDILAGTCYNYNVEYFMPYSLFGREARPDRVFFNPTMISSTLKEDGSADNAVRTWYNFGYRQTPEISKWGNPDQGYVFDRNGFVSNKITVNATGGKVEQEWGYDWCLTGDTVKFNVTPASGKSLVSIKVNGKDEISSVNNGWLAVYCTGDLEIEAKFA